MLSEITAILLGCFFVGAHGLLRTQLQKILYFASQKGLLKDSFGRGYYGPFSSAVANSAESLVSAGLLNETVEFFPRSIGYRYSLTQGAEGEIPQLREHIPARTVEELSAIIELCRNHTASSLSIAAKVHYVLKKMNAQMTAEEITSQAKKMKWNISPHKVLKASILLRELGLIK